MAQPLPFLLIYYLLLKDLDVLFLCRGLITSVVERESYFFCYRLLVINMCFLFRGFPFPLCAQDSLRYFILALPGPSIQLLCLISVNS